MDGAMAASFAALAAIFMMQEHVSARQFTAECLKNQNGEFLCANATPDVKVAPPQGMTGHVGCTMSCTLNEHCQHFNYKPNQAKPCQLFRTVIYHLMLYVIYIKHVNSNSSATFAE